MDNLFALITGSTVLITVFISVCVSVPFVVIAVFLLRSSRNSEGKAQTSQTWPSVLGQIASSRVEGVSSSNSEGGSSTSYYPRVVYEYEVLGHRYQSDKLAFGSAVGSSAAATAQAFVDRYVPGNQVRVYYDPNNPGEAVLERSTPAAGGLRFAAWFIIGLVVFSLCITLVAVLVPLLALGGLMEFIQ